MNNPHIQKIRNFRDLAVWNKGIDIAENIYKISRTFPEQETFGLKIQMQRCASSIPANIAEEFNRVHNKEYRQSLYSALGSCAEIETHLEIAFHISYLDAITRDNILENINHESRMLMSLIKKLK